MTLAVVIENTIILELWLIFEFMILVECHGINLRRYHNFILLTFIRV